MRKFSHGRVKLFGCFRRRSMCSLNSANVKIGVVEKCYLPSPRFAVIYSRATITQKKEAE
jgi:hypothetical protein